MSLDLTPMSQDPVADNESAVGDYNESNVLPSIISNVQAVRDITVAGHVTASDHDDGLSRIMSRLDRILFDAYGMYSPPVRRDYSVSASFSPLPIINGVNDGPAISARVYPAIESRFQVTAMSTTIFGLFFLGSAQQIVLNNSGILPCQIAYDSELRGSDAQLLPCTIRVNVTFGVRAMDPQFCLVYGTMDASPGTQLSIQAHVLISATNALGSLEVSHPPYFEQPVLSASGQVTSNMAPHRGECVAFNMAVGQFFNYSYRFTSLR